MKDTVIVPAYGRATVDPVADQPGLTLFHCHIQNAHGLRVHGAVSLRLSAASRSKFRNPDGECGISTFSGRHSGNAVYRQLACRVCGQQPSRLVFLGDHSIRSRSGLGWGPEVRSKLLQQRNVVIGLQGRLRKVLVF